MAEYVYTGLMKLCRLFLSCVNVLKLQVETDDNTLVQQLYLPTNGLPEALGTFWIAEYSYIMPMLNMFHGE